jgi:hypothetical protein
MNIPHMLLNLRHQLVERRDVSWFEKAMFQVWGYVMQRPWLYAWGITMTRLLQKLLLRQGWIGHLPPPFSAWTQSRDLKAVAPLTFSEHWRQFLQSEDPSPGVAAPPASGAKT